MSRDELLQEALYLINEYNVTAYEIEKYTSLTAVGVQKIINGESKRPLENTLKTIISYIKDNYSNNSEGSMLREREVKMEVKPVPYNNYMMVEYAQLSTAAGRLGGENPANLPDTKVRLVPKEFDNGNYLVVEVDGDSMDDGTSISIPDGTEILVKEYYLNNGDKLPIRGNLFVIVTTEGTVFKQIVEHNIEQGYIVCHSYNPKYKDYKILLEDILQIFLYRKIVSFRPNIPEI